MSYFHTLYPSVQSSLKLLEWPWERVDSNIYSLILDFYDLWTVSDVRILYCINSHSQSVAVLKLWFTPKKTDQWM